MPGFRSGLNKPSCSIPQLRQDVERLLASCLEEISTLPKPLEADPQIEVLVRVNAFCDAFKGVVSGSSSDKTLAQRNRTHYTIFARNIRGTSPDFRPFEQPTLYSRIVLESEEPWSVPGIPLDSPLCVQPTQSSWNSLNGAFQSDELQCTPVVHLTSRPSSPVDVPEPEEHTNLKNKKGPRGKKGPVKRGDAPVKIDNAPFKSNKVPVQNTSNKTQIMGLYDVRKTILESVSFPLLVTLSDVRCL